MQLIREGTNPLHRIVLICIISFSTYFSDIIETLFLSALRVYFAFLKLYFRTVPDYTILCFNYLFMGICIFKSAIVFRSIIYLKYPLNM